MIVAISNLASFRAEALYQRLCAVCESSGPWQAHHVVPKRWLKRRDLPLYDPRNALRLCVDCHAAHEHGGVGRRHIPVRRLVDSNICYIYEVMGMAGQDFLTRTHRGIDARWTIHVLNGSCDECR